MPDGEKVLQSEEKPETSYSIAAIPDAKTYEWMLNPAEAGEITSEGINATVAWNDDYHGEVFLSARALNDCGESEYGEALSISVNEFISVDENLIPALELFPNPTRGALSLTNLPAGESNIEIYDVEAKLVNQLKSNTSKLDFRIDKAGVFLVKITNGNSILTKKVVVK